ncbi:PREDICTED: uncharacterized protein LOC108355148, partial [Rhagoletis zephyria]|uniref:uncharacterized protein LOC108355148 n=1 Tax=Rhagoletis zephyria TaxID=28612 RepID=UPI00081149E7
MRRYNLRNRKVYSTNTETNRKVMPNSDAEHDSENELDCTVVEQEDAIAKLQEQIKTLQRSLAASENERLTLKQTLASTKAIVTLADTGHFHATEPFVSRNYTYNPPIGYLAYENHASVNLADERTAHASAYPINAYVKLADELPPRTLHSAAVTFANLDKTRPTSTYMNYANNITVAENKTHASTMDRMATATSQVSTHANDSSSAAHRPPDTLTDTCRTT